MSTPRDRLERIGAVATDRLLGDRRKPKGWGQMSRISRLEYIADRLLAENKGKNWDVLAPRQYRRRQEREVYGQVSLDEQQPHRGVFSRADSKKHRQRMKLGRPRNDGES